MLGQYGLASRIPVCLISLTDAAERRDRLVARGVPRHWVEHYYEATDLRNVPDSAAQGYVEEKVILSRYGRRLRSPEIGCAASHMSAYQWIAASKFDLMLILEDDIVPSSDAHLEHLHSICDVLYPLARAGMSFICHLGTRDRYFQIGSYRRIKYSGTTMPSTELVLHSNGKASVWSSHAYLVSRTAAKCIAGDGAIKYVADDFGSMNIDGVIGRVFLAKPKIYDWDKATLSSIQTGVQNSTSPKRSWKQQAIKFCYRLRSAALSFIPYHIKHN